MLQVTPKYQEYVSKRFRFLSEMVPYFSRLTQEYNVVDGQMRQNHTTQYLGRCRSYVYSHDKDATYPSRFKL